MTKKTEGLFDKVLKRMLGTPPVRHKELIGTPPAQIEEDDPPIMFSRAAPKKTGVSKKKK